MVKLIFTDQYASILLLVNGLAILLFLAAKKKNRQRAIKFGNYETLQKIAGKNFLKSSNFMLFMRMLALTALIVGLSNPVLVEQLPAGTSDYVLAIDSSASMLAEDLDPSRFEAAKSLSSNFISKLAEETSVGVVSFSGSVTNELSPSNDKQRVVEAIQDIDTGEEAGTAIGDALSASISMLLGTNKTRSVILITDGRNNVGSSVNDSIEFAVRNNVTVYTIGIGSNQNSTQTGLLDDRNGSRAEFPNLNEGQLSQVANETGGRFIAVSETGELESALISVEQKKRERDISKYFIFFATALLLTEWVLGVTRYSPIP